MMLLKITVRALRFIQAYGSANLKAAMQYRAAFWSQLLVVVINDSLWLLFWWNYFNQFPLSNGWKSTDIIILWSVTSCGFGISLAVFGNARQLATLIMNGGLDAYLGMPRHVLLHVCIAANDPSSWGDILFAVITYLFFLHPNLLNILLFVILAIIASVIFTSFVIIICSLSFFFGNTEGIAQQMFSALVTFSTYPIDIFHGAVRLLLFTVVPAGFISFVPLQLLHNFNLPLFLILLGFMVLIVGIAIGMFEWGLRRYESGNLLEMQG